MNTGTLKDLDRKYLLDTLLRFEEIFREIHNYAKPSESDHGEDRTDALPSGVREPDEKSS